MTAYIDMLKQVLVLELLEAIKEIYTVMLILKMEALMVKELNNELDMKLVLFIADVVTKVPKLSKVNLVLRIVTV